MMSNPTIIDLLSEKDKKKLEESPLSREYKEILGILFQAKVCPRCKSPTKMYVIARRKSKFGFMLVCNGCGLSTRHIHTNLKLMVKDWNEVCEDQGGIK